jgi:hypothetical protein
MTQKEKAAAYDRLVAHLRWSFEYHRTRLPEECAEAKRGGWSRYHDHNVHAAATALLTVDALDGICPCDYCAREQAEIETLKARESEGCGHNDEQETRRDKHG